MLNIFNNKELLVNEYLLIIQPNEDVKQKINTIKKDFAEKYECPQALYSKPHITLVKFKQYEMNEQKIIHSINNIVCQKAPIQVSINGFESFPTHTIYFNVETKNVIVEIVKSLKPVQAMLKLDKENKPHFITTPHLTLARKLLPWQYEKAWLEYSNTHFTASFIVNDIVLLRRNEITKKYSIAATFSLNNEVKMMAHQTSLF